MRLPESRLLALGEFVWADVVGMTRKAGMSGFTRAEFLAAFQIAAMRLQSTGDEDEALASVQVGVDFFRRFYDGFEVV